MSQIMQDLNFKHGKASASAGSIRAVFCALMLTQIVSNVDTGACCVLFAFPGGSATRSFHLTALHVGAIGSLTYLGHTIGCLIFGQALQKYHPKYLLIVSITLNVFCVVGFSLSSSFWLLASSRFISGVVSACVVVYGPVWVDEFALKGCNALWLAVVQGGVALGVMVGYVVAGLVFESPNISWRYFFQFQAAASFLCAAFFFIVDARILNHIVILHVGEGSPPRDRSLSISKIMHTVRRDVSLVLRNLVFVLPLLALCSLYFVVTGLQMWATSYLRGPPVSASLSMIIVAFGLCSATGPVFGVILGGWSSDKVGGYRHNKRAVAGMATIFGAIGACAAYGSLLVNELATFAVLTWFLLFFGGAVVPCTVGLCISSVPNHLRPLASGLCSCSYNLLGLFLGPFVGGAVTDRFGVQWGYRVVMGSSILSVLCMGLTFILTSCQAVPEAASNLQQSIVETTEVSDDESPNKVRSSSIVSPDSFHSAEVRRSIAHSSVRKVPLHEVDDVVERLSKFHFLDIR